MIFAEQINKGGWDAETDNPARRGENALHFQRPDTRVHASRSPRSRISAWVEQAPLHRGVRGTFHRKEDEYMPRKRKLPPNLRWGSGETNIFYAFDVDGIRFQGSTGTSDVLKAQEFLDRKVEAAYRDIRLGQRARNRGRCRLPRRREQLSGQSPFRFEMGVEGLGGTHSQF